MPASTPPLPAIVSPHASNLCSERWSPLTHPYLLASNGSWVSAPSPRSHITHTTCHSFGYSKSHTNTRLSACISWRCSSRCTHPRSLALSLPLLLTDLGCRALPNPQKPTEEAQTQRGDCHNEAQNPAVASSHPYPGRPEVYPHTLMFPRRQLQSERARPSLPHHTHYTP